MTNEQYQINSVAELEALYGAPVPRSLIKELDHLSDHYQAFVKAAPFVVVASCGPEGLDCSPRGDPAGFVRVHDARTVMVPDRRGNNRLDTLKNIVRDARISLLFLIPGVGETLRINGRARITIDPKICKSFKMSSKTPRSVIVVDIDRVYFQCQKALARSQLWEKGTQIERSKLPSTGTMIRSMSDEPFDADAYDTGYADHMKKTIY